MDFLKYIGIFAGGVVTGAFIAHTIIRHNYEEELSKMQEYYENLMNGEDKEPKKHIVGSDGKVDSEKADKNPTPHAKASYTDYINEEKEKVMTQYHKMTEPYDKSEKTDAEKELEEVAKEATNVPEEGLDIYEIDAELYSNSELRYDKEVLNWYPDNGILADESDYIFDEYNLIKAADKYLSECTEEGDMIYLRNETIEVDYEITTHLGEFTG